MNGKNSHNFRVFTNFLAFLILVVIAIASIIGRLKILNDFSALIGNIAKTLAYLLVAFASFWYVMSKRGFVLKIVWFASVAVIAILMFV